jgi:cytochrome P450
VSTQDDEYEGLYIPKGSTVIGNGWCVDYNFVPVESVCSIISRAILMDPSLYGADVDEFRPERFLDSSGNLDRSVPHPDAAFGFGRRKCAGQVVAQKILWLAIASMLSTFDITQPLDEQGNPMRPSGEIAEGLNWYVSVLGM